MRDENGTLAKLGFFFFFSEQINPNIVHQNDIKNKLKKKELKILFSVVYHYHKAVSTYGS